MKSQHHLAWNMQDLIKEEGETETETDRWREHEFQISEMREATTTDSTDIQRIRRGY